MARFKEGEVQTTSQGTFRVENGQWVPVTPEGFSQPQELSFIDDIGRQLGLTARAGIEGLASLPALAAEAPRQLLNLIPGVDFPPQQQALSQLLSDIGLPQPETPIERIAQGGAQALAGAGGIIGAGKAIAGLAPTVSELLTMAPGLQSLSAGAGGLAAATAQEQGVGPIGQSAAAIGVGFVAPIAGISIVKRLMQQSPTKQRIGEMIAAGSTDVETAKFKLTNGSKDKLRLSNSSQESSTKTLLDALSSGGARISKDKLARSAIKQGFDEGVIAAVKGASLSDKKAMLRMVNIMERSKKNALESMTLRPSDVAGNSLVKRINIIRKANRSAGSKLDSVAKTLKGKAVNIDPSVNGFIDDLSGMGVTVSDDFKLGFAGSDVEGLDGPIRILNQIFNRMKNTKPPDAYDVHRMKRFIDQQVTYGKSAEGLSGKAEGIIKKLRSSLDSELDKTFPKYDKVNSKYAETINVLDSIQDVAGKKMNLIGPSTDKALGTLLRRIMSNAQSRITLLDSINDIESVAIKNGGKFDDDLMTQILFVDELDSVFGTSARTSLQGQVKQAVEGAAMATMSPVMAGASAVGHAAERVRGINTGNAFKAIKELLKNGK